MFAPVLSPCGPLSESLGTGLVPHPALCALLPPTATLAQRVGGRVHSLFPVGGQGRRSGAAT
eukprot:4065858-Pyramimonas_sp.AAC.1